MLKIDKNDSNYLWVDISDIIKGYLFAQKNNKVLIANRLRSIFVNENETDLFGQTPKIHLKVDDEVTKFLKSIPYIQNWDETVDENRIKEALARSVVEYNHTMKKMLEKYLRKLNECKKSGGNSNIVSQEIIENKQLFDYIKQYDSFNEFEEQQINKAYQKIKKIEKKEIIENVSYVEYQYKKVA
ncbi:MAG: hypothetical protein ACK5HP_01190 [Bacilli bacterium]